MSVTAPRAATRGVVFIHSAPTSLCPHITWSLESLFDQPLHLDWLPQPAGPRLQRAEVAWTGPAGTGVRVATALRSWKQVRYEVTEDPSPGVDGSRWSHTPSLGIHHTWTAAAGDAVVNEDRLRAALSEHLGDPLGLQAALEELLGTAWDRELEVFRYAGDGAPVRWLHKVG